ARNDGLEDVDWFVVSGSVVVHEPEEVTEVIARPHLHEAPGMLTDLLELQCFGMTERCGSLDDLSPRAGVSGVGRHSSHEVTTDVETKVLQGDASARSASRLGDLLDGLGVDPFQPGRERRGVKGFAAWVGQVEA